jgi:hypothetical protein
LSLSFIFAALQMPPAFTENWPKVIIIMNKMDDDTRTNLTETPLKKKGRFGNDEDETGTNTISTYTESTHNFSPASNTRSGGKRKTHQTTDTAVLSDVEDIADVTDAAVLSKNNPDDGEKAKAEIIKVNNYERTLFDLVSRQHPRRSSPIWKYDYFKELRINRRGIRIQKSNRK